MIASQVSHDIRSPLAALEMISGSINELSEDKRLIIRNSINRIRDIANSLLIKNREKKNQFSPTILTEDQSAKEITEDSVVILLSPLIDSIVTEKRLQYRNHIGVRIDFHQTVHSYGLFSKVRPNEFQRVVSNLINNAVEALPEFEGVVEVVLQSKGLDRIELIIRDSGKGIPAEVLSRLGHRGETFGKEGGSGLGLYHAKTTIEGFQGTLMIDSQVNQGTAVRIELLKEKESKWFTSKIKLKNEQQIVVFDDDQSIHQIWDGRMQGLASEQSFKIHHFSNPADFRKFYGKNFSDLDEALFLMDYEIIGARESGLDLIESLGICKQSILVTSRYEDKTIRDRCDRLGVRLIPKTMSGFVPIEVTQ